MGEFMKAFTNRLTMGGAAGIKGAVAAAAIAWGSYTANTIAQEATDRAIEANEALTATSLALADAEARLELLNAEDFSIRMEREDETRETHFKEFLTALLNGAYDDEVKTRASDLDWGPAKAPIQSGAKPAVKLLPKEVPS